MSKQTALIATQVITFLLLVACGKEEIYQKNPSENTTVNVTRADSCGPDAILNKEGLCIPIISNHSSSGVKGVVTQKICPGAYFLGDTQEQYNQRCSIGRYNTLVTVKDSQTGVVLTQQATVNGEFSIALPPGRYSVSVEQPSRAFYFLQGDHYEISVTSESGFQIVNFEYIAATS